MFTNWLTGTTSSSSAAPLTATNRSHDASQTPNGLSPLISANGLTNLNTNIVSSPPDVVLEVGPGPQTMRFMAHSIVLGMHSGYLRSAIRLDERITGTDSIVYLSNVTAEQFAPLLSYMYTGYLDLNVENIFGVLLATHVLHMPRALEICRSYLSRAQAEGYFGSNSNAAASLTNPINAGSVSHQSALNAGKIIRPIASKPPITNFGYLPLTQPMTLPPLTSRAAAMVAPINADKKIINTEVESHKDEDVEDDIEVDELDRQSNNSERLRATVNQNDNDDEEDVEVFIDTNSEAEVVVETEIQKLSFRKSCETNRTNCKDSFSGHAKVKHEKSHKKSTHRSEKRRKSGLAASSSTGLQVAKAPIPASQLDTSEANKVIIDVASCDGPVRFKRILNTAYGHKPEACSSANNLAAGGGGQERSLQSVSLSFHQQMAKTISQQQQMHNADESENSETSNGSGGGGGGGAAGGSLTAGKSGRKIQNEVFVCVYCKHTFKSQYCYQKHAKRHLNPLTLQATCMPSSASADKRQHHTEERKSSAVLSSEHPTSSSKSQSIQSARPFFMRNPSTQSQSNHVASTAASGSGGALHNSNEFMRREVRPLDMNVQYYPCKTCGCKFPSYYFVHKHRKMCHAEEEAAAAAAATTTTTSSDTNEESMNTKSGN